MKLYNYIFFLIVMINPAASNGCSAPSNDNYIKRKQQETAKIFIGKAEEQQIIRNYLGEITKIQIRFLPLNITKGKIALNDLFWYSADRPSLSVVIGETYQIYANESNELDFGDFCYNVGTSSLGLVSPEELDKIMLERRIRSARTSESRSELTWAKEYIKNLIKISPDKTQKEYWSKELRVIESRLVKVF